MSKFLHNNILSLVLLAALMGFATTWQAEAKRAASMGPTVVATVNLNTVMDGLAERADLQAELAIEAQNIQAEQQQRIHRQPAAAAVCGRLRRRRDGTGGGGVLCSSQGVHTALS